MSKKRINGAKKKQDTANLVAVTEQELTDLGFFNREFVAHSGNNYSVASVIPSNMDDGYGYLRNVPIYNDTTSHADTITLCWDLYEREGVIGSAIDTMVELAVTRGNIENVTDSGLQEICEYWAQNVNGMISKEIIDKLDGTNIQEYMVFNSDFGLSSLAEAIMLHYLVAGDVVLLENWSTDVEVPSLGKTFTLPSRVILYEYNQLTIEADSIQLTGETIKVKISDDVRDAVQEGSGPKYDLVEKTLAPDLFQQVKDGAEEIELPSILTTHFKRKGFGKTHGIPYLQRAFSAIAAKRRLQALDEATIAGMIQRLTILMVGHKDPDSPYHVPQPGRVALLKRAVQKMPANKMLVWAGVDLEVIDIGPDGKVLSFENRFNEADDSISLALGMPRILIDGASSGTSSRDWVVVIKTVSMLERIRAMVKNRIDRWLRAIAVKNGFEDEFPTWRWSVMNLKDERVARTLILKAYEDGLVGRHDTLNFLGWDAKEIIEKQIEEKEQNLNELVSPPQPAYSSPGNPGGPDSGNQPEDSPDNNTNQGGATAFLKGSSIEDNITATYRGIKQAITDNKNASYRNILNAGFAMYYAALSSYTQAMLDLDAPEMADTHSWQLKTLAWLSRYVNNFKNDVLQYADQVKDVSNAQTLISAYLDSQEYRVAMSKEAIERKVALAVFLIGKELKGDPMVVVENNGDQCPECVALQGKTISIKEVFDQIPVHPKCTCFVE